MNSQDLVRIRVENSRPEFRLAILDVLHGLVKTYEQGAPVGSFTFTISPSGKAAAFRIDDDGRAGETLDVEN